MDQALSKTSHLHRGWTGLEMMEQRLDLAFEILSRDISLIPLSQPSSKPEACTPKLEMGGQPISDFPIAG